MDSCKTTVGGIDNVTLKRQNPGVHKNKKMRSHMRSMRQMNEMMNSMFANPFGMFGMGGMGGMGQPAIGSSSHRTSNELMPFSFPNMNRMFEGYDRMGNIGSNPDCHSFSSSSVMTMTSGPDGRPQVYQASSSMRTAPGGVKETKKSVCDSRSGVKKIAIGHHIGERAHVLEREQNLHSGEREERQEFINLEEEEAEDFNREFEHKTKQTLNAIGYSSSSNRHGRRHRELPALPSSSSRGTHLRLHPANNTVYDDICVVQYYADSPVLPSSRSDISDKAAKISDTTSF
ncbi:hypothetical protein L9F63_007786, partial [Diploptera punctata]